MNMKKISKLGVCLIGALAISSFAQDYAGQDLNTSFRDKRIDGFNFSDAKAKKGVTDFQRSAGEKCYRLPAQCRRKAQLQGRTAPGSLFP